MNGYPNPGNGDEVGRTGLPQRISAKLVAKINAAMMLTTRTQIANRRGMPVISRAAAHMAEPAPNVGTMAFSGCAVPPSITLSPMQ